jgi:hypothetical protein
MIAASELSKTQERYRAAHSSYRESSDPKVDVRIPQRGATNSLGDGGTPWP